MRTPPPIQKPRPVEPRFRAKIGEPTTTGCWPWTGYVDAAGYGRLRVGGRAPRGESRYAHRIAYELLRGSIPDGLQIDHLCRNRSCVNPDHLEVVTNRENAIRGARARQGGS